MVSSRSFRLFISPKIIDESCHRNRKAIEDVKAADRARPDSEKIAPYVHVFNSFFYKKLSAAKRNVNAAANVEVHSASTKKKKAKTLCIILGVEQP